MHTPATRSGPPRSGPGNLLVTVPAAEQQYGSSATVLDYVTRQQLAELQPETVVDFGAGGGKYAKIVRETLGVTVKVIAVEGFEKAARMLSASGSYDEVRHQLIEDWMTSSSEWYDLAIFGDVLEHLPPPMIHRVLRECVVRFKAIIVVCPLYDMFQESYYGNELEAHRSYITGGFFDRYRPAEKHIAVTREWTIMNVLIRPGWCRVPWYRGCSLWLFDLAMRILQPIGLARAFVNLLKRHVKPFRWILRG